MNLSYLALKEYEPRLNVHAYEEDDVWRIFKRDKIFFDQKPLEVLGYYEVDENKRESVIIDSKLIGAERLRTLLHETVHHYLDYPIDDHLIKVYRSLKVLETRQDLNAEMLSLVLMFPFPLLEEFLKTRKIPHYLEPYIEERLKNLEFYGF